MQKLSNKMDWDDLRYFIAVADAGSITGAAKKLIVKNSTISRHIMKLEDSLGIKLFERLNEGFRLTSDGAALYNKVSKIRDEIENIYSLNPQSKKTKGTVSISTTRILLDCFLSSRMKDFFEKYPDINIIFNSDNRNQSIIKRETDISLRMNRPADGGELCRKLVNINYYLYANKQMSDIIQKNGFNNVKYLNLTDDFANIVEYGWIMKHFERENLCLQTNSQYSAVEFIKSGACIGILPKFAINTNSLIKIDAPDTPIKKELWMLVRQDISTLPVVRIVMNYLIKIFNDYKKDFI